MSEHDEIPGENGPDESIPTDPGVQPDGPDESIPTDPGTPQNEVEAPTDPGARTDINPQPPVEMSASDPEDAVATDPGASTVSSEADEAFSSSLVAIILIVAMVVFATQGDHKDKAWGAMVDQVEHWTGLDFSEPKWGIGGEEASE